MSINGKLVREFDGKPKRFRYSDVRIERKGFLSVYSFAVEGLTHRHDLMDRGHAVVMLPADFAKRELYMIMQPRHVKAFADTEEGRAALVAARTGGTDTSFDLDSEAVTVLELPAGMIDRGETPVRAALRELHEETGIVVGEEALREVGTFYPTLGGSTERVTAFIVDVSTATFGQPEGDANEQIDVWRLPFDEAWRLIRTGFIKTSSSNILLRELELMELRAAAGK